MPLPAGVVGPVSSAICCEFHPSSWDVVKVPVMLGKQRCKNTLYSPQAHSPTGVAIWL